MGKDCKDNGQPGNGPNFGSLCGLCEHNQRPMRVSSRALFTGLSNDFLRQFPSRQKIFLSPVFVFEDVQTRVDSGKIIRAIDPDSKGRSGRVPGSQGTWDSLHFERVG